MFLAPPCANARVTAVVRESWLGRGILKPEFIRILLTVQREKTIKAKKVRFFAFRASLIPVFDRRL